MKEDFSQRRQAAKIARELLFLLCVLCGFARNSLSSNLSAQFRPVDEAGYRALLERHSGKIILVDFWASWCEPCRAEMPALVKLARRYTPQGFSFVTVSIDSPGELSYAEKFLKAQGVPFPAYYKKARNNERFIHSVDPRWSGSLPALFFYGRDGKLVKASVGETDAGTIEATVRELLGRPAK